MKLPHLQQKGGPLEATPAPALVVLAIAAIQLGAGLATYLFPVLGPDGTVAVRIIFSALLLGVAARGRAYSLVRLCWQHGWLLLPFALCIAIMNLFFYEAIARIPLGAAVAFEFTGPLSVAAVTSRRIGHFVWVALAATGIVLLSPLSGTDLDTIGVLFALSAGASWAGFIVLAQRVSQRIPGNDGLVIGMAIAAVAMIPIAAPVAIVLVTDPVILAGGIAVALLSTTVPFTLEFEALKRLSARAYGILISLEPAVAVIVGAVLLDERIGAQGLIAVGCVVTAAIGITITEAARGRDG